MTTVDIPIEEREVQMSKKRAPMTDIPTTLKLSEIEPEYAFNCRTEYDEKYIKELAESIRLQGVLSPLTVRKNGGLTYKLVSGYNRFQALQLLNFKEPIPVVVQNFETETSNVIANLTENTLRKDLHPADLAKRLWELETGRRAGEEMVVEGDDLIPANKEGVEKIDRKTLAKMVGKGTVHIGNLVRAHMKLMDDTKNVWRKFSPPLTDVFTWAALEGEEQETAVETWKSNQKAKEKSGDPKRGPNKKKDSEEGEGNPRPSKSELLTSLASIREKIETEKLDKQSLAHLEGKINALRYATGEITAKTILSVK